jgi:hypothetical protein
VYTDNIVEDAFRGADCTGAGTQGAVELRLIRTEQFGEDIFKSPNTLEDDVLEF